MQPGDSSLRSDIQLLADELTLESTLMVWPLPWSTLLTDLDSTSNVPTSAAGTAALERISALGRREAAAGGPFLRTRVGYVDDPMRARSFESTLRERGEIGVLLDWTGDRFTANVAVTRVLDAQRDDYRLDGSYLGVVIGDWALGVGSQERWWGPGWQGSLILSTNARPMPQLSARRLSTSPFDAKWLAWIGPWSLESFIGRLDDPRAINDALLLGIRVTAKPLPRLEIGVSRSAQFCGDGRRCDLTSFGNLLLGKDNPGINVGDDEEPGNQLGGFDVRWALPARPAALYGQWIGEDSRQGGPQIGSWLRLAGAEHWGTWRRWRYRAHVELADTICREGGTGFGGRKYNCGYEHTTYTSGYRYEGRSIGHGLDNDSSIKAIGATFTGPDERSLSVALRLVDVNQGPLSSQPHGLSSLPVRLEDLTVSHRRHLPIGDLFVHLRAERIEDVMTGTTTNDASLGLEWRFGD